LQELFVTMEKSINREKSTGQFGEGVYSFWGLYELWGQVWLLY
jgi:hypothetical protein